MSKLQSQLGGEACREVVRMCYRRQGQDTDGPVRQTISHVCLRMAMKNKGGEVSGCQSVRPKNLDR